MKALVNGPDIRGCRRPWAGSAWWGLVMIGIVGGCGDPPVEAPTPVAKTGAECDGGAPAYDIYLERRVTEVGPSSNAIVSADDQMWVVESGANTVSAFDRITGQMDHGRLYLGQDQNPYDLAIDDGAGELWVTNYSGSSVSVASDQGEILATIEDPDLANPSSVALSGDYAYISDVNYLSQSEGFGPGSIAVIDRQTHEVVNRWETTFKNPQYIAVETIDERPVLLVSGSGALAMGDEGVRATSAGGLEYYDLGDDPRAPSGQAYPLGQAQYPRVGAPGRPMLNGEGSRLYFVSALAPVLFVFDIEAQRWRHDAGDPFVLYEADGDTTHGAALGPEGLLWVSAFNEDALYLVDTTCDAIVAGPIDVGQAAHMLEGPQAIAWTDEAADREAYFIYTIANAMGRIRLEPTGESL